MNKKYVITGDCRKLLSEERFALHYVDGCDCDEWAVRAVRIEKSTPI